MGFHTVIATIIVSVFLIAIAYTLISGNTVLAETTVLNYKEIVKTEISRFNTKIEILNVTYNTSTSELVVYFKNTGVERIPSFDGFDMLIYGRSDTGNVITAYVNANYTITTEILNPGIFDPAETAKATATIALDNGTYYLQLCTNNAVCSGVNFIVS